MFHSSFCFETSLYNGNALKIYFPKRKLMKQIIEVDTNIQTDMQTFVNSVYHLILPRIALVYIYCGLKKNIRAFT